MNDPVVISLNKSGKHTLVKYSQQMIELVEGYGVVGDAHYGKTVKHRSRVAKDPTQPNLRQVHLIHSELFDELRKKGLEVNAGEMGENITTRGIDLLSIPADTILSIGSSKIKITGLRNPCSQLDSIQPGLMKAVLDHDKEGKLVRKAGIMAVVINSGTIKVDDKINIILPPTPHRLLEKV